MPDFSFLDDLPEDGTIRINTNSSRRPARRAKPKTDPSPAAGCLVFLLLLGGCFYFVGKMPPQTAADFEKEDHRILAVINAQSHIKGMLVAPRSAKWPGIMSGVDIRQHARKLADGTYAVRSYVDSQNGFGAMVRTYFTVRLRVRQDGNADILADEFEGLE